MGMKYFSDSSDTPRNDDMYKFKIKRCITLNGLYISEIRFLKCTTYGGNKILVTSWNPRERSYIDPHFIETQPGLYARFVPTSLGWDMAKSFVKGLK